MKIKEAKGHTLLLIGSNDPSLYVKVPSGNYMFQTNRDGYVIKKVMVGPEHGTSMVVFNFSEEEGD